MALRLDLQSLLETILGSENVYFQPPANILMKYPAIVYSRDDVHVDFASNRPYNRQKRYQVTVIDRDPDSEIPDRIGALPMCAFARHYAASNLHHDVFNLYF